MDIQAIGSTIFIVGSLIGVVIFGGPLFLATLAVVVFLAIRQWSETIEPLDRSSITIITLAGATYLTEVYLTLGSGSTVLLVPFLVMAALFAWQHFARRRDVLGNVSRLVTLFLLIPYGLGFFLLLRDLPDAVGIWATLSVFGTSLTLAAAGWAGQRSITWVKASRSIVLAALVGYILLSRTDLFTSQSVIASSSFINALAGYFGLIVYQDLRQKPSQDWLAAVLVSVFVAAVLYLLTTIIW